MRSAVRYHAIPVRSARTSNYYTCSPLGQGSGRGACRTRSSAPAGSLTCGVLVKCRRSGCGVPGQSQPRLRPVAPWGPAQALEQSTQRASRAALASLVDWNLNTASFKPSLVALQSPNWMPAWLHSLRSSPNFVGPIQQFPEPRLGDPELSLGHRQFESLMSSAVGCLHLRSWHGHRQARIRWSDLNWHSYFPRFVILAHSLMNQSAAAAFSLPRPYRSLKYLH